MKICIQCRRELRINPENENEMACANKDCIRFGLLTVVSFSDESVVVEDDMADSLKVVCSLPNIDRVIGARILEQYGNPINALNHLDSWEEIEGIGKKKLDRIKSILEERT